MRKKKQSRYIVLDLGDKNFADELISDKKCTLALKVHKEDYSKSYSRNYVQRDLPCRFEGGKLYKS